MIQPTVKLLPLAGLAFLIATLGPPAVVRSQEGPPVVAVFDFQASGTILTDAERNDLTDYLVVLVTMHGYQAVPREQIYQRIKEKKQEGYRACVDEGCQVELGRELAAQKTLSSKVLKVGDECRLTVVLYDLKRATTQAAASESVACTKNEMLKGLERAIGKLKHQTSSLAPESSPVRAPGLPPGPRPGAAPPRTSVAAPEPSPKPAPKPAPPPVPVTKHGLVESLADQRWNLGLRVGAVLPSFGDSLGLSMSDGQFLSGDLGLSMGFRFEADWCYRIWRYLAVGPAASLHLSFASEGGGGASGTAMLIAAGVQAKALIPLSRWWELRPTAIVGAGFFLATGGYSPPNIDTNLPSSPHTGVALGFKVELATYLSPTFGLLFDCGMIYQTGAMSDQYSMEIGPLFYLGIGVEYGG